MVVEVSPWQIASTRGRCCLMAASISPASNTRPHSVSIEATSAPTRRPISTLRWPKRPKIGTSILSPGDTMEARHASMPALAVPSIRKVQWLAVRNTWR